MSKINSNKPIETGNIRLNLGSGKKTDSEYINLDIQEPADVIHNLNVFPYPFKESSVSEIKAWHILEHLNEPKRVMYELWRICKSGGKINIRVPWYKKKTVLWNPEHKHDFMPNWFKMLETKEKCRAYSSNPQETFKVIKITKIRKPYRLISWLPKVKIFKITEIDVLMKVEK